MTKIISGNDLILAKESLDNGNIIIFPTETVYGLGANALDKEAVSKIFFAKGRPSNNPLIVHLKDKNEIDKYAIINNETEKILIDKFMPGPFTLILEKKDIIPDNVTCNMNTVGIRIPDHVIAHNLLSIINYPIAAPSANISGKPSGTRVNDIYSEFNNKVDFIIDGGETIIGLESTVVKVIDGIPTILRPGFITREDIESVIGNCKVSEYVMKEAHGNAESPGMLYKHYAPITPCILVDSKKILEESLKYSKCIIIGSSKNKNIPCLKYFNYGDSKPEIAHNIFRILREADKIKGEIILIEALDTSGLGLAIMNRLIRTCGYNYIK